MKNLVDRLLISIIAIDMRVYTKMRNMTGTGTVDTEVIETGMITMKQMNMKMITLETGIIEKGMVRDRDPLHDHDTFVNVDIIMTGDIDHRHPHSRMKGILIKTNMRRTMTSII